MYYQESAFAKHFSKKWVVFYHIVGFAQTRAQTNLGQCDQGSIKHQVHFVCVNKFYKLKLHVNMIKKYYIQIYILSISTNCISLPLCLCDVAESAVSTPLSSSRSRFNRLARLNTDGSMNVSVTCPRPGAETPRTPRGRLRTLSGPTSLWILSFMFGKVWIALLDILL